MGLLIGIFVFLAVYITAFALNVMFGGGTRFSAIPAMLTFLVGWWLAALTRNKYNVWRGISKPKEG